MQIITINLPEKYLAAIQTLNEYGIYPSRSEAIRIALKDFLTDEKSVARLSLENICYTAGARRSHHEYRVALVSHSRQTFIENMDLDTRSLLYLICYLLITKEKV